MQIKKKRESRSHTDCDKNSNDTLHTNNMNVICCRFRRLFGNSQWVFSGRKSSSETVTVAGLTKKFNYTLFI